MTCVMLGVTGRATRLGSQVFPSSHSAHRQSLLERAETWYVPRPHQQLAQRPGFYRESASAALGELRTAGIISVGAKTNSNHKPYAIGPRRPRVTAGRRY